MSYKHRGSKARPLIIQNGDKSKEISIERVNNVVIWNRLGKRKCRPSRVRTGGSPCARCEKMGLACSLSASSTIIKYREAASPEDRRTDGSTAIATSDSGISGPDDLSSNASFSGTSRRQRDLRHLDTSWKQEMVDNYFDVVHDKHHSLFHRPTFESDLGDNQVPEVILCAILSLGSR